VSDLKSFIECVGINKNSVADRALAFLYYRSQMSDIPEASVLELREDFRLAGLPVPPSTRLKNYLAKNRATTKIGADKWRIRTDKQKIIAEFCDDCLQNKPTKIIETDSVIPRDLSESLPKYCEEVIRQINGCYDAGYFDSANVMIRRLVESLIIEIFEKKGIETKLHDRNGNYAMLNDLINKILSEPTITLGRNAKKGLNNAKWLGDQSAHNRRFLATKADIDRVQPDIRILVQEFGILLT